MLSGSLPLVFLLSASVESLASPSTESFARESLPLRRRSSIPSQPDKLGLWAKAQRDNLAVKYGGKTQKRSVGTNQIINQNADSSYLGSLAVGTPPVSYDVVLDTGSADLWLADSNCLSGCSDFPTFKATDSSTFVNESIPFSITYGSGQASGTLGQDIIRMGGFEVSNQIFAVCNVVSSGIVSNPASGLIGLAFQTIASSGATPFWQTLVTSGAWDEPLMAFHLTRFLGYSNVKTLEPGGSFTMGGTNSSLYTGDIEYIDLPSAGTYWLLPVTSVTSQGTQVQLPSGSSLAAIDTGTTLVGAPESVVADIFAQIPNSERGSGNFDGYYLYPCDTTVNVTLSFGGRDWAISPQDFQLSRVSGGQCLGAFFEQMSRGSGPQWIVGDTFLKNVYSVFRYSPASVGFATLSDTALALNGADGPVPTPSEGSSAPGTTVTAINSAYSSFQRIYGTLPMWSSMILLVALVMDAVL